MKRSLKGRFFLALLLLFVLSLLPASRAQEEKTPSQKTKEAVEKFHRAPGDVRKSLEAVKELGKAKLRETFRTKSPAKAKAKADSLTLPTKKPERPGRPRYSAAGKRDPFRPLGLKTRVSRRQRENLSPLERYDLGQLKLVGIVWNIKEPRAMIEDAAGLGYIIKIGTPIGANEGKVAEIKPTEVLIKESYIDFYGARKSREVSMKLPKE